MTDPGRARGVNEAARRFAETLADSYRLDYEQATESAVRSAWPRSSIPDWTGAQRLRSERSKASEADGWCEGLLR